MKIDLEVQLYGPFKWIEVAEDNVFTNSISSNRGIYLFTAPFKSKFMLYYVGETGKSFIERLAQHFQAYLIGQYHIYDAKDFINGTKTLLYEGWFNIKPREKARIEYLERVQILGRKMLEFIECMRLFLIPLDKEKRILERVEAAIHKNTKQKPSPIGTFQDEGIVYRHRRKDEDPLGIHIKGFNLIAGLDQYIEI